MTSDATSQTRGAMAGSDSAAVAQLDDALHALWRYGRYLVLSWCPTDTGVEALFVPNYLPAELLSSGGGAAMPADERGRAVFDLVNGRKQVAPARMLELAALLGIEPRRIVLESASRSPEAGRIEDLARRYSVSRFDDRAVVLFDIVGFSLQDALTQLTQLNSLAYSINVAHERLRKKFATAEFARTTTGDGYYVWNRVSGIEANINLYHLMHLVLADNAIAQAKSKPGIVPALKTAYHIGSHYEFFQDEALRPTRYSYIVGDVTIQLARLMEHALAGQVMVGEFDVAMPLRENSQTRARMDATAFIDCLQESLGAVRGIVLSGERIMSIKCYLTGPRMGEGGYGVTRHVVTDKHGRQHAAYNAKINIFREQGAAILLGLQESEIVRAQPPIG